MTLKLQSNETEFHLQTKVSSVVNWNILLKTYFLNQSIYVCTILTRDMFTKNFYSNSQ